MSRIKLALLLFTLAWFGRLAPWATSFNPGVILIGGEYTVQAGETRSGEMLIIFAQVNVAQGGQVLGNVRSIGSALNVTGRVAGKIEAYGGQLNLDPVAQVEGAVQQLGTFPKLPRCPSILMVIS